MLCRIFFFCALTSLLALAASPALGQTFVFDLRGDQEVPPVSSPASGGCMGVLNQGAGTFALTCVHDVTGATIMHIHRGAVGVNGPVVFDLGDPASPVTATWTGMMSADIADILAGNLYINIHTAGRPAGEIRGQVLVRTVDTVSFTMDGSQNVPSSATTATGNCVADLDDPATQLSIQCTHDVVSPIEANVHEAPFGQNGPVVFSFADPASPISGNVPMTPLRVAELAAAFLYVDVHVEASEDAPGGDIRGQIGQPPAGATTGTIRITKTTFPAGGSGFGFTDDVPGSPGSFTLNDGQTHEFLLVPPGVYSVAENDPGASPGGFALTDVSCDDADSQEDPFSRTATIQVTAGEVVTCVFKNFAVSPSSQSFVFHLNGSQEVPPEPSAATGGCMGLFDAGASQLALICTHNVVGATILHIHRGAAGVNGPIAFDLGSPESPVQAVWTGMTPADVADLLAGNLYLNIHASGRPNGEIRGQILERTVDSVTFPMSSGQQVPPVSSPVTGGCLADLGDDAAALFVRCAHNVSQATAAHLHDAPPGQNGPVVFDFALGNPFSANVPMTPRLVADFAAGFLYVNVHSNDFPDGEIRGQVVAAPATIPALGQWGLILLPLALAALAWRRLAAERRAAA
ncbi:MAG TPA: CHRD domain-containing protein [Thermoanaerobaculia bacterium]|jgi:hypothetical protein|nr:CHRD domain-containing protein [Thermoanaerobaculia bacterium]